jgi:hypothetical protein
VIVKPTVAAAAARLEAGRALKDFAKWAGRSPSGVPDPRVDMRTMPPTTKRMAMITPTVRGVFAWARTLVVVAKFSKLGNSLGCTH